MNKGPKIVYVPIDDTKLASKPVTSGGCHHSSGGIIITSTSNELNSDDIIIQELAYT